MKALSFDDYKNFYHKYGRCIDSQYKREKPFNEAQLLTKYTKYERKLNTKKEKVDDAWTQCRKQVRERDENQCQLYKILSESERAIIKDEYYGVFKVLDPAHVFRKSTYGHMEYVVDNVYLLSRLFHSRLDSFHDPLTGKAIDKQTSDNWWRRIIGDAMFEKLLAMSKTRT